MMKKILQNSGTNQHVSDIHEFVSDVIIPCATDVVSTRESLKAIITEAFFKAQRVYSSQTELYRITDSIEDSGLLRFDFEDGLTSDEIPIKSDVTKDVQAVVSYNTNAADINKVNQDYLDYLRTRAEEVVSAIAHTDFEDGMDNDVTLLVKGFIRQNKSATYIWINELYSKNLNKPIIVEGILRTLAMITEIGDENILLPIVVAGLRSEISAEQEAAIMVIEEWRTKECLEAIRSVHRYASDIIKNYAMMVAEELKEELA